MTATNIDLEEFINVLSQIHSSGIRLIHLDMIPDDSHPSMNKLIIHPVKLEDGLPPQPPQQDSRRILIKNPDINPNNNDIFDAFKELL